MTTELSKSTDSPRLAVIIPVYNVEKYLPKCLDSIINQTYKNLQIICVDDGSSDNCGAILDEYAKKDSRIIVIHKENGGVSSARNLALDYIFKEFQQNLENCSKYITFVDSDDYIDVDAYTASINNFYDDIDFVCFGHELLSAIDSKDQTSYLFPRNKKSLLGKQILTDDILTSTEFAVTDRLFKSDIIFKNNIRFPNIRLAEDGFFSVAYMLHCRAVYFDDHYYYKVQLREGSAMSSSKFMKDNAAIQHVLSYKALLQYMESNDLLNCRKEVFLHYFYHMLIIALGMVDKVEVEHEIYDQARKTLIQVKDGSKSCKIKHYKDLIFSGALKESVIYKYFGFLKIKHRMDYDKYYFLWIPVLKVIYEHSFKEIKIFGITISRSGIRAH